MPTAAKLILFLLLTTFAPAQTPVAELPNMTTICSEACVLTAISTGNAVMQFGTGAKNWCPTTFTPIPPFTVSYASPPNKALCAFDPDPNVVKQVAAQQQATAYTVTYTLAGKTTVVTVPALVLPIIPAPTASPAPGTFTAAQSVMLGAVPGASIYYSLTGTASQSSTLYNVPIPIPATSTLSYLACMSGYQCSAPQSGTWTINIPPPVTTVNFTCPGTAKGTLTGTVISNLTFNQTGPCVTGANQ